MASRLSTYDAKRDFSRTSEPAGTQAEPAQAERARAKPRARRPARRTTAKKADALAHDGRFVIQEHHATSMHWDFRLERDGVLVSWAVPKGLPPEPGRNNLAIHVEDHPLDYIDFEGEIPKGNYGAGQVTVWDRGTYECEKFTDTKVVVNLHGERVTGRYALFSTGGNKWMVHRMDPPQDPDREPMPEHVKPMLAKLADIPANEDDYAFEIKWDGIRAMVYGEGGRITIESRNLNDITAQYPELARLGRAIGSHESVIDGEIVAFADNGQPSFQLLQSRMGLKSDSTIRRRMQSAPVTFVAFDILYLDGRSTMGLPYTERRALLEGLGLDGPSWQTPAYHVGDGQQLLAAAVEKRLEGIMAKRLDSPYCPGKRTGTWLKVKQQQRQELVIGGYSRGQGSRTDRIGALLVGYHDVDRATAKKRGTKQKLIYAGSVGTGFNAKTLARMAELLEPLEQEASPFDERSPGTHLPPSKWRSMRSKNAAEAEVVYCAPKLVCEVEYTEFTNAGTLRHPSFKGLRDDKHPRDVVREHAADAGTGDGG